MILRDVSVDENRGCGFSAANGGAATRRNGTVPRAPPPEPAMIEAAAYTNHPSRSAFATASDFECTWSLR